MSNIKKLYKYNCEYNTKLLAAIMRECAPADSACSMKDATAPGEENAVARNKSILSNAISGRYDNLSMEWSGGSPVFDRQANANNSTQSSK